MIAIVRNTLTREKHIHKNVFSVKHGEGSDKIMIVFNDLTYIYYSTDFTVFLKVM